MVFWIDVLWNLFQDYVVSLFMTRKINWINGVPITAAAAGREQRTHDRHLLSTGLQVDSSIILLCSVADQLFTSATY